MYTLIVLAKTLFVGNICCYLPIFNLIGPYLPSYGCVFDLIYQYFTVFSHILLPYTLLTIDTCHVTVV